MTKLTVISPHSDTANLRARARQWQAGWGQCVLTGSQCDEVNCIRSIIVSVFRFLPHVLPKRALQVVSRVCLLTRLAGPVEVVGEGEYCSAAVLARTLSPPDNLGQAGTGRLLSADCCTKTSDVCFPEHHDHRDHHDHHTSSHSSRLLQ